MARFCSWQWTWGWLALVKQQQQQKTKQKAKLLRSRIYRHKFIAVRERPWHVQWLLSFHGNRAFRRENWVVIGTLIQASFLQLPGGPEVSCPFAVCSHCETMCSEVEAKTHWSMRIQTERNLRNSVLISSCLIVSLSCSVSIFLYLKIEEIKIKVKCSQVWWFIIINVFQWLLSLIITVGWIQA